MIPGIGETQFARTILKWFDENRRPLPWRETSDPYFIWLSEVILQQTRVAQGLSYYKSLTEAFPTVVHLAKAKEEQVLRMWQGLGYYSRARNLHRCARVIADEMHGKLPDTYAGLVKLPGIGPYTAAAIASIAFNEQVAVLDGNVYRVLARIFGVDADISSPSGRRLFHQKAAALVPSERPGDFNQAMMELGAIQCTPRNPDCSNCPFVDACVAFHSGSVHLLPVKKRRVSVRRRYFYYFIFSANGKIGLRRRGERDIWQGLYDFYLVESERRLSLNQLKRRDKALGSSAVSDITLSGEMRHQLSHQSLNLTFYKAVLSKKNLTNFRAAEPALSFYSRKQAERLPKPVPVTAFLAESKKVGRRK